MNIMQLLIDTGLNAFAAKLLAESWDKLDDQVKQAIPTPLKFVLGNCEITLRNYSNSSQVQPEILDTDCTFYGKCGYMRIKKNMQG